MYCNQESTTITVQAGLKKVHVVIHWIWPVRTNVIMYGTTPMSLIELLPEVCITWYWYVPRQSFSYHMPTARTQTVSECFIYYQGIFHCSIVSCRYDLHQSVL